MADTDTGSLFPGYFWGNSPNVNQQLRQRIALQMMANKKAYPKNIGEGLSAIGDAIGERGLMKMLEQQDVAAQGVTPPAAPSAAMGPRADAGPTAPDVMASARPDIAPATRTAQSEPGVEDGGYNFIDAQAGGRFKPTPGYLRDAIAAREPNPDMQAYFGGLSGQEAPKGARDVSSTGAAGPYQFTRGTGARYGIPGEARFDPEASTDAVRKFTADNAAKFEATNGRPPTFQELAVMHQQGAKGGIDLLAGRAAPAGNLAVNNMAGFSPQAAVAKMNRFYGMPNEAAPVGRDAIAATLAGRPSEEAFAYAPTASLGGDVTSDAPSVTGVSPKVGAAAAETAPAPEVPQANPTMSPPAMPSALTAATAGSPPEAQGNRPIVTDIKPQPPAPGAQMAQAQPGYVTPQPSDPTGAPIIPPKPREVQLRQWLAVNQGNPYAAMKVAPELEALQTERTTRQNEANELYKAKIAQQTEQVKMREQQLADQAKRIADVAHVQAQTRKENIVENPEEKFMMGPDGVVRPIRVEGEDPNAMPGGKLTEDQRKTLVYHGWAKTGNQAITGNDQMLAHGLQQELLGKIPFAGNAVQSDAYRRAKNGADNFILAFMRSTSGAQYGATERLDHAKAMLPRYGDDAKTLADKANQRQQFVDSEYAGLGKQGQKMADFLERKHDPVGAERKQQLIDIEMQGVKGGIPGEVKTNRKTGEQRLWNGTRWVEVPRHGS